MADPRLLVHEIDVREALDFLAAMIRFRSYSGEPGETALARFLVGRMRDLDLAADPQPVAGGRCNAIGTLAGAVAPAAGPSCSTGTLTPTR